MCDTMFDHIKNNASPDLPGFLAKTEEAFPTNLLDLYLTPLNHDELKVDPEGVRPVYDFVSAAAAYEELRLKLLDFRAELENIEGNLDPENDNDPILFAICAETLELVQTELDLLHSFIRKDYAAVDKLIAELYGDTPVPDGSWRTFYHR